MNTIVLYTLMQCIVQCTILNWLSLAPQCCQPSTQPENNAICLHCTVLQYTTLHCTVLIFSVNYRTLKCTALNPTLQCNALHCNTLYTLYHLLCRTTDVHLTDCHLQPPSLLLAPPPVVKTYNCPSFCPLASPTFKDKPTHSSITSYL